MLFAEKHRTTFPGQLSKGADEILKSLGFQCTMSCEERVNTVTRAEAALFCLGRFNRAGTLSTAEFMRKIESPES